MCLLQVRGILWVFLQYHAEPIFAIQLETLFITFETSRHRLFENRSEVVVIVRVGGVELRLGSRRLLLL